MLQRGKMLKLKRESVTPLLLQLVTTCYNRGKMLKLKRESVTAPLLQLVTALTSEPTGRNEKSWCWKIRCR